LREIDAALVADERDWLARIAEWSTETQTGDRAEIEDLPDDLAFWSELTATGDQCLGRECPRYTDCFVTKMRDRAAESSVVIVNHHLLCADASVRQGAYGEVIPECDVLVVDEAHQLEDVVTNYFGVSVSTHRVEEIHRDGTQALGVVARGDGSSLREQDPSPFSLSTELTIRESLDRWQMHMRQLFDAARVEMRRAADRGGDRVTLEVDMAERLHDSRIAATAAAEDFEALLRTLGQLPDDVKAIATRVASVSADLATVLSADDARYVHFLETRGRSIALRAAPIDVADLVRDEIVGSRHATVFTSATLTVERSFDYMVGRLGAADAATLRLPSEFDFREQAILFLPSDMPDPRSPEFNRAAAWLIGELLDRTSGRAFVLFTSYAAMREVVAIVEPRVSWPVFVQGTASRTAMLRDFRATPNAVLFATASFWQGVDVAGEALSCVIIDRLPFASPGDPLVKARIDSVNGRGGNAFQDYQIPVATLTLLQGLGRLIRARTDRGVLAILDPRLTQKSYGRRFLASLPPAPITDDLEVVARFLA
jgi:ATP-dependent DNA helicase DinG